MQQLSSRFNPRSSNAIMGRETDSLIHILEQLKQLLQKLFNLGMLKMQPLQINLEELYLQHQCIVQQSAGTEDAENTTITNAGTIYSVNDRAIYFYDGATNATITNQKGGIVYNTASDATVQIDTSSTLTNSGTIDNRDSPSNIGIAVVAIMTPSH